MDKISFLTFTDIHISSINPSSRKGSYEDDIYKKLVQIREAGKKLKVDFFICGGDLYNLKAPMRNPHELNTKLITLFKSYPAPVYMTEGNHDLRNDSYETFNEQPLQVIYSSDALIQARNLKKEIRNISFRIRSIPFQEEPRLSEIDKAKDDVDLNIFILHLYATLEGGMLFKTKLFSYDEIAELGDDIFVLGHYHVDQGIEKLKTNGKEQHFINLGAISRGALSEEDTKREPKIGYVTVKKENGKITIDCKKIRLNVKPVEEAFDLIVHEREKREQKEAQEFVEKLKVEMIEAPKEDLITEEIDQMDLDKKVLNKVKFFLEEAYMERKRIE